MYSLVSLLPGAVSVHSLQCINCLLQLHWVVWLLECCVLDSGKKNLHTKEKYQIEVTYISMVISLCVYNSVPVSARRSAWGATKVYLQIGGE